MLWWSSKKLTANDLMATYIGAANQHALRMSCVTDQETAAFDADVVATWSEIIGRQCKYELFFLPMRNGGFGVSSAVNRRAAAPWTAWRAVLPQLVEHANVLDIATLMTMCPTLANQLSKLQRQLAGQTNKHGYANKTLDVALRKEVTHKSLMKTINERLR